MDKKDEKSSSVAADSSHTKTENALATLTQDMFDKLSLYVRAQIEGTCSNTFCL